MANLYEISGAVADAQYQLSIAQTDEDREDAIRLIDECSENLVDKLKGYGSVIANLQSDAAAFRAEERRLAERRIVLENAVTRLKARVLDALRLADIKTQEAGTWRFTRRMNNPRVEIESVAKLPDWAWKHQDPVPDKLAILEELKSSREVPGCRLVRGESVLIK